jgi:hypothetical protein
MLSRRFRLLLALIALLPRALAAQSAPVVLPLNDFAGHLYVTLTEDHLGPLTLMLDSGFQRTALAATVASKGQVHTSFWRRSLSYNGFGTGPAKRSYRTADVSFRSAQTVIFTGSALVTDFGDLQKQLGHPVDGFLGWDFFQKWCATLDYAPAGLTLRDPAHCIAPLGQHTTLRGEWTAQGLLLPAVLTFANGRTAAALLHFDTGSDTTLLLNTQFRAATGLDPNPASASESHGFGVNGRYTSDLVRLSKIELENQLRLDTSKSTIVAIARPGAFATVHWWEGPAAMKVNRDGILGNGLLSHFRWTFDPAAKRIYAVPSAGH